MADAPFMLSVSGCRGIVGSSMTPAVAVRFASALAAFVRQGMSDGGSSGGRRPRIVLARDGRAGGQVLHQAAAAGLAGAGCDVVDIGIAMTPTVGQFVDTCGADAGLVITASHNPQIWNGLKPIIRRGSLTQDVRDACAPSAEAAARFIALYEANSEPGAAWDQVGTVTDGSLEARDAHLSRALQCAAKPFGIDAIRSRGFVVAVDSVNSSGRLLAAPFLEALGCTVHQIAGETTGLFPHVPEPLKENLGGLCEAVRRTRAAVGFAQDPDADRLALIDENGAYIGEEYTLALAAEAVLSSSASGTNRVLCTNLSTSRMIEDVAARHGAKVIRTAVGEANVVSAMKKHEAIMGGEGNGGVILPSVTYIRDSLSAMALILGLLARTGQSLSTLVRGIPAYAIVKRKIDLPSRAAAAAACGRVASVFADQRMDRQDGVWVGLDSKRAWLHVRASNTEPILRLIAEAPTESESRDLLDRAQAVAG